MNAVKLVVPENGIISLNISLTNSRPGSFSTRTTHPHFIQLMRDLLKSIDIPTAIELPYRFRTKGEMIKDCANQQIMTERLDSTMSCSRPGASRFIKGSSPTTHCVCCYPCLIRRAAIYAFGISDRTEYLFDDLSQPLGKKRVSDLRALKIALDKYQKKPPQVGDILIPGPLPVSDGELSEFLDMFRRGIKEVRDFLAQYK